MKTGHRNLAVKHSDELVCMIQTEKLTSLTEPIKKPISGTKEAARAQIRGDFFLAQHSLLCSKLSPLPQASILKSQAPGESNVKNGAQYRWLLCLQLTNLPVRVKLMKYLKVDFIMTTSRDTLEAWRKFCFYVLVCFSSFFFFLQIRR